MQSRRAYPSDVSDEEWALVAPYLTLLREDAAQRDYTLREASNGLRYVVRYGIAWRAMPHDLPPGTRCMTRRNAGCGGLLRGPGARPARRAAPGRGRAEEPTAVVLDSRTLRSTPESGDPRGWDGHKRIRGSKLHAAVDTLGQVLALHVTPADANDRAAVAALADAVQEATGSSVDLAYVDQGYTGERAAKAAADHGIALEVVRLPEAKRGFVLLPRRWVVERAFAWMARFRRLARDYERLPATLAGLHLVAFSVLLLRRVADFAAVRNSL